MDDRHRPPKENIDLISRSPEQFYGSLYLVIKISKGVIVCSGLLEITFLYCVVKAAIFRAGHTPGHSNILRKFIAPITSVLSYLLNCFIQNNIIGTGLGIGSETNKAIVRSMHLLLVIIYQKY